jgi:uncharacterized membrane protein YfcA
MYESTPRQPVVPDGSTLLVVFGAVFAGGLVTGVTGFGYAIVATATLASLLDPRTAIVVVIVPILAANVSLVFELDRAGFTACARRFWAYVAAGAVGTVLGMAALAQVQTAPLTVALGVFTLGYVAATQPWFALPGTSRVDEFCVVETHARKGLLGFLSGIVFGASNVGVQVVAYLRTLSLDRSTFVGVVAMVFLGIGIVRVGAAWVFGLYASPAVLALSVAAALPGLVGVALGRRLRSAVPRRVQELVVYLLLAVIGGTLVWNGGTALVG